METNKITNGIHIVSEMGEVANGMQVKLGTKNDPLAAGAGLPQIPELASREPIGGKQVPLNFDCAAGGNHMGNGGESQIGGVPERRRPKRECLVVGTCTVRLWVLEGIAGVGEVSVPQ